MTEMSRNQAKENEKAKPFVFLSITTTSTIFFFKNFMERRSECRHIKTESIGGLCNEIDCVESKWPLHYFYLK